MKKRFFAVTAVALSSLASQHSIAQVDTVLSLDEAQVTATKYPSKTSQTGKVVTIIGKAEIERNPARDLAQLLSAYSGLTVTGANGSPGKDKTIFLRGAPAEYTLILVDGVPVYDPSGIGGHFDIRNISLSNVERIEIVKGSQSTLYGSSAIAGVINLITKKSVEGRTDVDASVLAGSNETIRASAAVRGKTKKSTYYANYSFHNSHGISDATPAASMTGFDRDGYMQHAVDLGTTIALSQNVKLKPYTRLGYHKGDLDDGAFADELDFTYRQTSVQAGLSSEIRLKRSRLFASYSFSLIDRVYIDDSTRSRNGFDIFSEGIYEGTEHFIDVYTDIPFTEKLRLTAGADFRLTGSDQLYRSLGSFPYSTKYSSDSLEQTQSGIYAALNLTLANGFSFEAGGRINIHTEYGTEPVFNLNPSFLINEKWKLFANLSSGYRTPTVYQLYSEFGNRLLKPEKSLSFESGVQFYSTNRKSGARVVFFKRNVNDILYFYTDPATFRSQYINQDRQRDHGVEAETKVSFGKIFSARFFYNYLAGEIHTRKGSRDTTYNNLIRRPRHSTGVTMTLDISDRWLISTQLSYTGEREDLYFDPFTYTTVQAPLAGYFLWDLSAEYRFRNERIIAFTDLRNITSSDYTEISGFSTLGFNAYAGVRLRIRRR